MTGLSSCSRPLPVRRARSTSVAPPVLMGQLRQGGRSEVERQRGRHAQNLGGHVDLLAAEVAEVAEVADCRCCTSLMCSARMSLLAQAFQPQTNINKPIAAWDLIHLPPKSKPTSPDHTTPIPKELHPRHPRPNAPPARVHPRARTFTRMRGRMVMRWKAWPRRAGRRGRGGGVGEKAHPRWSKTRHIEESDISLHIEESWMVFSERKHCISLSR